MNGTKGPRVGHKAPVGTRQHYGSFATKDESQNFNVQILRYLDDVSSFHPPSGQKTTKTEALACMAVDVLTLLTVIITGSAVLLAQSRRDA